MNREPADLDYANVIKRSLLVATRPENLLVLFFGAALVVLGATFSFFVLAGPLAVGYAEACAKMTQGRRVELDDLVWRGLERIQPSIIAGLILSLAITAGLFILVIPGMLVLLFAGMVYSAIALDDEPGGPFDAIQRIWNLVSRRPVPLVIMGLISALIGGVLNLAGYLTSGIILGLTATATVGFFFVVSSFVYQHYFPKAQA